MDPVPTRRLLGLSAVIYLAIGAAVLGFLWAWPVGSIGVFEEFAQPPLPAPSPLRDYVATPLTRRVLVVIHDSVRHDVAQDPEVAPYRAALERRGASGKLWVPGPTLTGVSLTCFGSGVTPPLGTAFSNFVLEAWPDEHVISLIRRRHEGLRLGCYGDEPFYRLFGETAFDQLTYPSEKMAVPFDAQGIWIMDRRAMDRALETVTAGEWDFVVVHLSTSDKKAHLHHARARDPDGKLSAYARSIRRQDDFCAELARAAGPETTVFWLSDHGCTPSGTHGTFEEETRRAVWAAAGPGIRPQPRPVDLEATALATIWCRLFGVRGPRRSESLPPSGLFTQEPAEELAMLRANRDARRVWFEGSCAANGWEPTLPTITAAPGDDLRAALRQEIESFTPALATARDRARRLKQSLGAGAALVLTLVLVFLGLRSRGAGPAAARRLALGLSVALVALFAWRWWPWAGMAFAQSLWTAHALAGVLGALLIGGFLAWALPRAGRRIGFATEGEAAARNETFLLALSVLAGFLVVAWPYGPKRETFGLLPILVGTTSVCLLLGMETARRSLRAWSALFAWGALIVLSASWIDDDLEVVWAARDPEILPLGRLLAPMLQLGLAILVGLVGRRATGRIRALELVGPLLGLAVFALASVARAWDEPEHEALSEGLAFGTLALWALVVLGGWWARGAAPTVRAGAVVVATLGLYRLMAGDLNQVFGIVFAGAAWLLFAALDPSRRPRAVGRAALVLLLVAAYWFLQGYRYKESTFDSLLAFVFAKEGVAGMLAGMPFFLQQWVPWILAFAPALAFGASPAPRRSALLAATGTIFLLRVALVPLVLPLYRDEGWFFLWNLHFVAFEAGQGLLAALALGLLAPALPAHRGLAEA